MEAEKAGERESYEREGKSWGRGRKKEQEQGSHEESKQKRKKKSSKRGSSRRQTMRRSEGLRHGCGAVRSGVRNKRKTKGLPSAAVQATPSNCLMRISCGPLKCMRVDSFAQVSICRQPSARIIVISHHQCHHKPPPGSRLRS